MKFCGIVVTIFLLETELSEDMPYLGHSADSTPFGFCKEPFAITDSAIVFNRTVGAAYTQFASVEANKRAKL